MTADILRIALAQRPSVIGTQTRDPRPQNLSTALRALGAAAARGAQLVVFGEMFLTGLRTDEWLAKWAVRPHESSDRTLSSLSDACRRLGVAVLIGTATVDEQGICRNSVLLTDGSGRRSVYHKRHLAQITLPDGYQANELLYYSPGDAPGTFGTEWGRIGLQICYEVTFPEIARCSMLDGADLIINCTASIAGTEDLWTAMASTRAFENGTFFVACSVVGHQGPDEYFGGSAAYDPHGACVAQAAYGAEDLLVVEVPVELSRRTRTDMNIIAARRPELYGALAARTAEASPSA